MTERDQPKYWIGVVSRDHVQRAKAGGFCQLGHGKKAPLLRMKPGDWLIYYSSKITMAEDTPCQCFTAIGKVKSNEPYQVTVPDGFEPFRLDVDYLESHDTPIKPLLDSLTFIKDVKRWGFIFRMGHFEISKQDFELISSHMQTPAVEKS